MFERERACKKAGKNFKKCIELTTNFLATNRRIVVILLLLLLFGFYGPRVYSALLYTADSSYSSKSRLSIQLKEKKNTSYNLLGYSNFNQF